MMHTDRVGCAGLSGKPKHIGRGWAAEAEALNQTLRSSVPWAVDHRICLECAYPVKDLPKCPECGLDVDSVTLRIWSARQELVARRGARLKRTLGVLLGVVLLCGLGMYGLCNGPSWGLGRASGALTDHWLANVLLALALPSVAVLGAWLAPFPLLYFAKAHDRLPIMCIWEESMWRFHVPWMTICAMGPIFAVFIGVPFATLAFQMACVMVLLLAWAAICLTIVVIWVQAVKRRLHEVSLLHRAPAVWLILWGVPVFLAAGLLGFFAGMFSTVRSMELWGTVGVF